MLHFLTNNLKTKKTTHLSAVSTTVPLCHMVSPALVTVYSLLMINTQSNQNRPVGRVVNRSYLEREVGRLNLETVKSDTVLPTARHRCDVSSKGAVLRGRNDAEMGPANSFTLRRNTASIMKDGFDQHS